MERKENHPLLQKILTRNFGLPKCSVEVLLCTWLKDRTT